MGPEKAVEELRSPNWGLKRLEKEKVMAGEVAASHNKLVAHERLHQPSGRSERPLDRVFRESVSPEGNRTAQPVPPKPQTQPPDTVCVLLPTSSSSATSYSSLSHKDGNITSTKIGKFGKAEIYFSDNENLPYANVFSYWPTHTLLKGWV